MAVQRQTNNENKPFILGDDGEARRVTFGRDQTRTSADIERYTVVTRNPSSGLWYAYTAVDAVDGTQVPMGIVMETVDGAALHAGNVTDIAVLKGNALCDVEQLVLENSLTLADIINWVDDNGDDVQINTTIEQELRKLNIRFADTIDTTEVEA